MTLTGFHSTDRTIQGDLFPFSWFHTNPDGADFYYSGDELGRKYKVCATFENPLIVSREQFIAKKEGPIFWRDQAVLNGHDGVVLKDITDGDTFGDVFCVFDYSQPFPV